MSSLMVHLLAAHKNNPDASVLFWIGNIAPDIVWEWKEKDKTHLRDKPDRLTALSELAGTYDLSDEFCKGVIFHLYLDYLWDIGPLRDFIKQYKGETWIHAYRSEIAQASAWLFHHTEWSRKVWADMAACPMDLYANYPGYPKEEVSDLIKRNLKWHHESSTEKSAFYIPDFIDDFTSKAVTDFKAWLLNIQVNIGH